MIRIVLLLSCLTCALPGAQAGELFRWQGADGKVHYGDTPPAGAAQIQPMKFPDASASGDGLPYETRRAQQNFPVILYVADSCTEYCAQARNLLNKRGIPFSEKNLQTQEDIDAFKALSGSDSVPTLAVGRSFLTGFLAEQWHNELNIAGYPKIAPYRAPGTAPAPAAADLPATTADSEAAGTTDAGTTVEP